MNKKAFISIFIILIVSVTVLVISGHETKYVKGDINDIIYAEPTDKAKNFDIEGYINKLKPLEYEKIDYPVKEKYTYNFNDYVLTVNVPEGYNVCEEPLPSERRLVYDSKGFKDSCMTAGELSCCADKDNCIMWKSADIKIVSDSSFVISKESCGTFASRSGLDFYPYKSAYAGINLRDIFVRKFDGLQKKGLKNNITKVNYVRKFIVNDNYFHVAVFPTSAVSPGFSILLDDDQGFRISGSSEFSLNEVASILDSIHIKKIQ